MILYLFHLIFKILFFFQVLYILTLKIIIDMHSLWSGLICSVTSCATVVMFLPLSPGNVHLSYGEIVGELKNSSQDS